MPIFQFGRDDLQMEMYSTTKLEQETKEAGVWIENTVTHYLVCLSFFIVTSAHLLTYTEST